MITTDADAALMPIGFVHLYAVTSDKLKVTKPTET